MFSSASGFTVGAGRFLSLPVLSEVPVLSMLVLTSLVEQEDEARAPMKSATKERERSVIFISNLEKRIDLH